ncbi:MAP3K epsilon protein kinase [Actinidia chinensis var. chinensis]|uniref:non-specific serine/threonine protein kinase n=1 Tax=Actinidia chinensis var. chinensis TaxID=1590841 RepID=A0A2R6PC22_ACTCC|nr:MAP3K epsilon protein kinase [Actinidia chinensis var. chinensis]
MSRPAASSAFHKSKTLDNKYMLGDEIGKGAYGRVYKGLDLENGDFVAIKQVSLENIAQEDLNIIMQEIDLLKNLNHKNIVKYLGSLKTKTHLHIILEYVENGSLANIIKPNKFGPFPESLVVVYIAQVLEGLVYLHDQGVIHRDIKGANILTTKEGLVKLADFGVATKLTEADVNTHSVVGTPYWMAPEVIEMSGVCAASDIWSVGCTVIELLTCVPPYYDLQPMPALFRIVQDEHPPIPDSLSPDITDFLRQCFKKDARQRPDAKTLLSHPWIQNSRRVLQSSLRHSGTIRNVEEDGALEADISNGDAQRTGESPSAERIKVTCSVLQVLYQIIKDNSDFQENACLVGLIPVVMSFAVPDRPREIRMEAAYFLQQLCQSSSLTLQMFIACRGIPILVGFLEADYAKYREMVHLAIDGMWQVFKLQRSTPRNDFCRIAAKNGILLRLINTLYSLNEATRLASLSGGSGFPLDGLAPQPRSGPLDPNNPSFAKNETPSHGIDQPDPLKVKQGTDHPLSTGAQEPSCSSASYSPDSRLFPLDADRPQSSIAAVEPSVASRLSNPASLDKIANVAMKDPSVTNSKERENLDRLRIDTSRAEVDLRQQRVTSSHRTSTDKAPKLTEGVSNGFPTGIASQQENVRPLLSLLDKEPPSRHFSGQLEYVCHLSGLERHESILPLLHASNDKKANGLDFLMAEFAEVSGRGRDNANLDSVPRISHKTVNKKVGPVASNEGVASTSGFASQTASGVLSGSGVLNARPGSTTSSGLLSHMVSTFNADVAREYVEKVADLLLEFAGADTTVKSYMCSQSLLSRLFQMFNRIEPPILLKLFKCINHLSTDPHCLENLQRADAIKYLIPNLDLKEGPLVSQIHHEVLHALFNLCKINKRRQEQAAENGIIPHLMHFIMSDSPLKRYALPLLCDMAHASRNSREQLRAHGGLDVYLSLLEDNLWSVTALDSIAVCLAHDNDNRKVEQALLKKDAVQKLVKFFQCCPEQHFVHILEPFLKIITKSSRINTILAVNGLTPLLISRLDHQDAIARLNLLKLIKAVYEHHPRPKQLIVENDLPQKLKNLIEERRDGQRSGGQVLVKQMATSLLKALHINTVL